MEEMQPATKKIKIEPSSVPTTNTVTTPLNGEYPSVPTIVNRNTHVEGNGDVMTERIEILDPGQTLFDNMSKVEHPGWFVALRYAL